MATSSYSLAASKFLNLRNPAVQYLIRRQVLHPCAAASFTSHLPQSTSTSPTLLDAQLIHPKTGSTNHELNARNLGIHVSYLHQYLRLPSGPCFVPAHRTYATRYPKDDAYEDHDDDDDDDDDDEDEDGDFRDYGGSDFSDDEGGLDDVDEDPNARPRSVRYKI